MEQLQGGFSYCFSCDFNVFFMVGEPRFKVVFSPISADECGFDVEF